MKLAPIHSQILDDLDALEHVSRWSLPIQRAGNYLLHAAHVRRRAGLHLCSPHRQRSARARHRPQRSAPDRSRILQSRPQHLRPACRRLARRHLHCLLGPPGRRRRIYHPHLQPQDQQDTRGRKPCGHLLLRHLYAQWNRPLLHAHRPQRNAPLPAHPRHAQRATISSSSAASSTANSSAPSISFSANVTDDGHYLVVTIERGVPARRVDICFRDLTKPKSLFEVLVWGLDSRFSTIYANGAWYVKTDYNSPNGPHPQCRSRHHARSLENNRPRRQRRHRGLLHRRRQNLRQAPPRCEIRNQRLHPRGQARRHRSNTMASAPLPASTAAPSTVTASSASSPSFSRPPFIASTRSPANATSSSNPKSPSTPRNTNSSRSSTNLKTARRSPCSSPAKKACSRTAPSACS